MTWLQERLASADAAFDQLSPTKQELYEREILQPGRIFTDNQIKAAVHKAINKTIASKMGKPWRWQTQTLLHDPENGVQGNCVQTALASLLAIPVNSVPEFATLHRDAAEFWDAVEAWLSKQGYVLQAMPAHYQFEAPYLVSGPSPRSAEYSHMVVMNDGVVIHDPHPSGDGIAKITNVWLLLPRDPGALRIF